MYKLGIYNFLDRKRKKFSWQKKEDGVLKAMMYICFINLPIKMKCECYSKTRYIDSGDLSLIGRNNVMSSSLADFRHKS